MRIFLAAFFFAWAAASAYASPILRIDKPQHDFGEVTQEDKVEHVFQIENNGDSDLVIEKLVPS